VLGREVGVPKRYLEVGVGHTFYVAEAVTKDLSQNLATPCRTAHRRVPLRSAGRSRQFHSRALLARSMRTEILTESTPKLLSLSASQVGALRACGRRLASSQKWWREAAEEECVGSVIHIAGADAGQWSVRVSDAIGFVAVPGLELRRSRCLTFSICLACLALVRDWMTRNCRHPLA
jgi:hypothetical protein